MPDLVQLTEDEIDLVLGGNWWNSFAVASANNSGPVTAVGGPGGATVAVGAAAVAIGRDVNLRLG